MNDLWQHIKQTLGYLFSPAKLADTLEEADRAGHMRGYVSGRADVLQEIARMPREHRRKLVRDAVTVFGRKPASEGWAAWQQMQERQEAQNA